MLNIVRKVTLSLLLTVAPVSATVADTGQSASGHTQHNAQKQPVPAKVTLVYEHELPDVPGKSIKGVLVEYAPGAANPSHIHAPSALIYATVLEGAVLNQINDGALRTFRKGESFTELPGDFHNISANASTSEPARLLAIFIVDTDEPALTTPATKAR